MHSVYDVGEYGVAVAHSHGIRVCKPGSSYSIWLGVSVIDVARVSNTLWICTSQRYGYVFCLETHELSSLHGGRPVFCVSGPCGYLGAEHGLHPHGPLRTRCVQIVQNPVLVCALHLCGHVVTFRPGDYSTTVHILDTGLPSAKMNVIGDLLCVDGLVWRDGIIQGECPMVLRAVSTDGCVCVTSSYEHTT